MHNFRLLILCLALCAYSCASITSVQHLCTGTTTTNACVGTGTCTVSGLSAVGAGHLLVGVILVDNAIQPQISSINGETWTHCTSCTKGNGSNQEVDASYVLSSTGGETSFQVTLTLSSANFNFCVYDFSTTSSGFSLDGTPCGALVSSSTPNACTVGSITGTSDVVLSAMVWGGNLTGVSAPYSDFFERDGNGIADSINASVGTGAHFTPTTSNSGTNFSVAFKEAAGGGATCTPTMTLMGVGQCG